MIFRLLGMVLDEISYKTKFEIERDRNACIVECSDQDVIGSLFLPLFGDNKLEEIYDLLEKSEWFLARLCILEDRITEITLENNLGETVISVVETQLLEFVADIGMDDSYLKICREIIKKC